MKHENNFVTNIKRIHYDLNTIFYDLSTKCKKKKEERKLREYEGRNYFF